MKFLVLLSISMSAAASGLHGVPAPTGRQFHDQAHGLRGCQGGSCKVCKNCKYCKHCAKDGGTCSKCK